MVKKISIEMSQGIVRCLKERHKKTIAEIAKLAGTTKKHILKIENGEDSFTPKHIKRIDDEIAIFVSLIELLTEDQIVEYRNRGQEVPKNLSDMYAAFRECLSLSRKLKKKREKMNH